MINFDSIIFFDIETDIEGKKIYEFGALWKNRSFKSSQPKEIENFLKLCNATYLCGHNFIEFDQKRLQNSSLSSKINSYKVIDTLWLSLLLFNEKSLHSLPKEYKDEDQFANDPIKDCKLTQNLLHKLLIKYLELPKELQSIFFSLLHKHKHFEAFFQYISTDYQIQLLSKEQLFELIYKNYPNFEKRSLQKALKQTPAEVAYIIALITPAIEIKSHPPKILYSYPHIVELQKKLLFNPKVVSQNLSIWAKESFGFESFRTFARLKPTLLSSTISQSDIIQASFQNNSFIAVLPTGGGKTFTFWLPAIIKAAHYRSLTVVISPLQALIEDHINSFNAKVANYKAVAISGYMSPLERAEAIEMVANGEADILYLAPESLRSNAIFNILKNRYIERFVIDEAHCLSTWGNDFRQDYYYIAQYIQDLLKAKNFQSHIPVSCFTATAKPSVIQDIKNYFLDYLDLQLDEYIALPNRKNLTYKVFTTEQNRKYRTLLEIINKIDGPTLIYIPSSTKKCDEIASMLQLDTSKSVASFHAKLDSQYKIDILQKFIANEIDIIVATTAFGMGVDKADIVTVIHYEISDSLENYAQEAGRGARDEKLQAFCPILFDEDDLDKHFATLNRSKITASEINAIFRVIKKTKSDRVTKSALELAKEAGWDIEDESLDYATKVKTALLELEREGYIKRERNKTSFYADSVATNSMNTLHKKLQSENIDQEQKNLIILVMQQILNRGHTKSIQVDELAYLLGASKSSIALAIQQLKEMQLLADNKDMLLNIFQDSKEKIENITKIHTKLINYLFEASSEYISIKELNQHLIDTSLTNKNETELIKELLKGSRHKELFHFVRINRQNDIWQYNIPDEKSLLKSIQKTHTIARSLTNFFYQRLSKNEKQCAVEFSLKELKEYLHNSYTLKEIDKTLLFMHHLKIIELIGGRFIGYSPMQILKLEKMKIQNKRYTLVEYAKRLKKHYQVKTEAIHIVGEYAKILHRDSIKAKRFMTDYFTMPYESFKRKYKLFKDKISRPITQKRFNKIFQTLSQEQQAIIADTTSKAIMILAGPGSGKTKVMVHKIASLILTEDIKPEQFLMLTFSKTAASEFRHRLKTLLGALSYDVEISTFHAYALKLIARVVKEDENILQSALQEATKQILHGDIYLPHISVLVLDEYQDINHDSFEFVKAIYKTNSDMRIIAVGDDDQCIMKHIGSDISYIESFKDEFGYNNEGILDYKEYELITNFRSDKRIVEYSNNFIQKLHKRYKTKPLVAKSSELGTVEIVTSTNRDLIPLVLSYVQKLPDLKSTAILAFTNQEVLTLYTILDEMGIHSRYIIDRQKFHLKNIAEIVEFDKLLNSISKHENYYTQDEFLHALQSIELRYEGSENLSLLKKIINRYLMEQEAYYISSWLAYLDELVIEDFYDDAPLTLSTIHKSKGKEFDRTIVLVHKDPKSDDEIRLYYVAMTRAKKILTIFRNGNFFQKQNSSFNYIFDNSTQTFSYEKVLLVMSLSDINLAYKGAQHYQNIQILAGKSVTIKKREKFKNHVIVYKNHIIGLLSNSFERVLQDYFQKGYKVEKAAVEFVVYWYHKESKEYRKQPLCKVVLKKVESNSTQKLS